MDWLQNLLFDENSIAHIVLLYSFVIAVGVLLGKLNFRSIVRCYFCFVYRYCLRTFRFNGEYTDTYILQDFGLILFVFCIGLQVGPSFSLPSRKEGLQ